MSQSEQITPPANIVVIGLGNMGQPMAACLSRAGYQVVGYDASPAASARFSAAGGKVVPSAAEAVSKAAVVVTLLPDGKIVRKAIDGIRPHLAAGGVVIDMSSSAPVGTKQLGEELIASGFEFYGAEGLARLLMPQDMARAPKPALNTRNALSNWAPAIFASNLSMKARTKWRA